MYALMDFTVHVYNLTLLLLIVVLFHKLKPTTNSAVQKGFRWEIQNQGQ